MQVCGYTDISERNQPDNRHKTVAAVFSDGINFKTRPCNYLYDQTKCIWRFYQQTASYTICCEYYGIGNNVSDRKPDKKLVCILYKISSRRAKVVFFENEENKQVFIAHHLIREGPAYKLNGAGVNLDDYPFTEYPDENEPIRFLFIGRVMREKGVDELFEAARRIKKEYPEVQFDIVGPMEDEYEAVIKKLEQEGIITYYGYQKDVRPFIKKSSCFVLPSWHEGMANTNLECSASGRPVITSNIHGCKEAVEDGVNGYLCKKKDTDTLYKVLKRFVRLPYKERRNMGRAGRMRMEKFFDKRKIVTETISELYSHKRS